jgi:hypothetical protein
MTDEPAVARRSPLVRVAQCATIAILVVVNEAAPWAGHAGASYGVDGLALLVFLGFRWLRRSSPGRS